MGNLKNYNDMLKYALENHFTLPAMNSGNFEMIRAVTEAADEMNTPIIIQVFHSHLEHPLPEGMVAMANMMAGRVKVPVALGLDHGESFEQAKRCIESGFTGVMIDLASEDYDKNVFETKKVVEYAHAKGVSVEAELGTITTGEASYSEIEAGMTDPVIAEKFAEETGIDCLAVSIGTVHGPLFKECRINFPLLDELVARIPCPVVVHGASGTPDADIEKIVKAGVAKLNIGTDLFMAFDRGLTEGKNSQEGKFVHPIEYSDFAMEAVKQEALKKMRLLTKFRTD